MKYLKHTIALLCFSFLALFVVVLVAIKITTLFSGSITLFYSIQLALEVLLSLGIILWMKREKLPITFTASKWKWSYLIYFFLIFLLNMMTMWIATIFQNYIVPAPDDLLPRLPDSVFLQGTGIVVFLKFVQSVMTGPILEELTCRAYMMNVFFKHSRLHLDVLVSALFFFRASSCVCVSRSDLLPALFCLRRMAVRNLVAQITTINPRIPSGIQFTFPSMLYSFPF